MRPPGDRAGGRMSGADGHHRLQREQQPPLPAGDPRLRCARGCLGTCCRGSLAGPPGAGCAPRGHRPGAPAARPVRRRLSDAVLARRPGADLVGRRIAHPGRAVDVRLADWVGGTLGLRRGQTRSWSGPSKHSGSRRGNCRRSPPAGEREPFSLGTRCRCPLGRRLPRCAWPVWAIGPNPRADDPQAPEGPLLAIRSPHCLGESRPRPDRAPGHGERATGRPACPAPARGYGD